METFEVTGPFYLLLVQQFLDAKLNSGTELEVHKNPMSVDNEDELKENTYEELKDRRENVTKEKMYTKFKK